MSDHTQTWLDLLRELDRASIARENAKIAAMTQKEREAYLQEVLVRELVNMP